MSGEFDSNEHAFITGQLLGTLLKDGWDVEPGATSTGDYLPGLTLNARGKQFVISVVEVGTSRK